MDSIAIHTEGLNKTYNQGKKNEVKAVQDLDLRIKKGEIYGLLGENGAGKTTTVRILTTMMRATSGTAKILGHDVVSESSTVRRLVGCLPQDAGLYEEFSAVENLAFIAELRGLDERERRDQIDEFIGLIDLEDRKKDRVETYSGGMKRRLMIARSMLGNPNILFLDEPTAGIDVLVSRRVRELIKRLATTKNITVLVSTHDMLTAERICDRVGILKKGKLITEDTPTEIIKKHTEGEGNLEDAVVNLISWSGDDQEDD